MSLKCIFYIGLSLLLLSCGNNHEKNALKEIPNVEELKIKENISFCQSLIKQLPKHTMKKDEQLLLNQNPVIKKKILSQEELIKKNKVKEQIIIGAHEEYIFKYDTTGMLISKVDTNTFKIIHNYKYEFDKYGRLSVEVDSIDKEEEKTFYFYGENDSIIEVKDVNHKGKTFVIKYCYDTINNIKFTKFDDVIIREFRNELGLTLKGETYRENKLILEEKYFYNEGLLWKKYSTSDDGLKQTLTYTYDDEGRLILLERNRPFKGQWTYKYNNKGLLIEIVYTSSKSEEKTTYEYTYY